jgi:L-lactate dehydrogenase complex protein LldE
MVRKHYPELLAVEPVWLEKARTVGGRLYEASQFLSLFVPASRIRASFSGKVTYHDSCHSSRSLGIYQEPRALLAQVKGLELLEMADSKACCGFGGLFSRRFPEVSQAIAGEKVKQILATGAEWVVGNDPGCLMNIQGGLNRVKSPVKVKHLVEILNSRS